MTAKADAYLDIIGLSRFRDDAATDLPMGAQKLLEVIRALMARPQLLLLDEPAAGLNDRLHEVVGNFSGGQHQMLAIARGLMANPKLLILDEPSLGLSPLLVSEIFQLIGGLRDQGMAILLSEQNARLSLAIADHGYVIENGRVAMSGQGCELLRSSDIAERYLGVGAAVGGINESGDEQLAAKLRQLMND